MGAWIETYGGDPYVGLAIKLLPLWEHGLKQVLIIIKT